MMDQKTIIYEYIEEMKNVEENFLQYIEEDDDDSSLELNLSNFLSYIDDLEILKDKHKLYLFLHLISEVSNNHFRFPRLKKKLEQLFISIKEDITTFFSNKKILDIFKDNKLIVLILLQTEIIIPNNSIADVLRWIPFSQSYKNFFYPEFKTFFSSFSEDFDKDPEYFYSKRELGQNDNYLCELIQKDLIQEFIPYVTQNTILLTSTIEKSIYETNPFLYDKELTLIEYAAFFGSIQIFKYLIYQDVDLQSSIWLYAIHSNNPELIKLLEDYHIDPPDDSFDSCFIESIKCHHHSISQYILDNYMLEKKLGFYEWLNNIIIHYNFIELSNFFNEDDFDIINWPQVNDVTKNIIFYDFCKYNYFRICEFLAQYSNVDIVYVGNDYHSTTVLICATEASNYDIIQLLFSTFQNMNINHVEFYGNYCETALSIAIKKNDLEIVQLLLSHPDIDVNFGNYRLYVYNEGPLYIAVENNNIDIIKHLLKNPSINVNHFKKNNGELEYALNLAVKNNEIEIVKLLLEHPSYIEHCSCSFKKKI